VSCRIGDVTALLKEPSSPVLKRVLPRDGARVYCVSAEGLSGLIGLEPYAGIRIGRELGEIARTNSLGGVIHSDEFRKQGVSEAEEEALRRHMHSGSEGALVLIAGDKERAATVARLVKDRLEAVPSAVLRETRAATEEGETRYLRPRPGAARMYPETDIPDIVVTPEWVAEVKKAVPIPWEERVRDYSERYSLSQELALQLYDSDRAPLFESLAGRLKLDRSVIASILVEAPVRLSREGVDESRLSDELLTSVVQGLDAGAFAKEGAFDVLRSVGRGDAATVDEAVKKLGMTPMDDAEIERIVGEVVENNRALIQERGDRAFSVLMGEVMKVARGKVDGGKVSAMIRRRMKADGRHPTTDAA
jgi:glutamyl-tRNA(Gln) amidotransferase subunit E